MPGSENVQVVRDHIAATNAGDFARAGSYYSDDMELVVSEAAALEQGTFQGREAFGRWFANWFSTFERGYRFEVHEVRDLGDGVVLMVTTHHGRGKSSGMDVARRIGYLFRVRGGKIVRTGIYASGDEALEAAAAF